MSLTQLAKLCPQQKAQIQKHNFFNLRPTFTNRFQYSSFLENSNRIIGANPIFANSKNGLLTKYDPLCLQKRFNSDHNIFDPYKERRQEAVQTRLKNEEKEKEIEERGEEDEDADEEEEEEEFEDEEADMNDEEYRLWLDRKEEAVIPEEYLFEDVDELGKPVIKINYGGYVRAREIYRLELEEWKREVFKGMYGHPYPDEVDVAQQNLEPDKIFTPEEEAVNAQMNEKYVKHTSPWTEYSSPGYYINWEDPRKVYIEAGVWEFFTWTDWMMSKRGKFRKRKKNFLKLRKKRRKRHRRTWYRTYRNVFREMKTKDRASRPPMPEHLIWNVEEYGLIEDQHGRTNPRAHLPYYFPDYFRRFMRNTAPFVDEGRIRRKKRRRRRRFRSESALLGMKKSRAYRAAVTYFIIIFLLILMIGRWFSYGYRKKENRAWLEEGDERVEVFELEQTDPGVLIMESYKVAQDLILNNKEWNTVLGAPLQFEEAAIRSGIFRDYGVVKIPVFGTKTFGIATIYIEGHPTFKWHIIEISLDAADGTWHNINPTGTQKIVDYEKAYNRMTAEAASSASKDITLELKS